MTFKPFASLVRGKSRNLVMTKTSSCTECGSKIPIGSPPGLCPRCLLRAGFDDVSDLVSDGTEIVEKAFVLGFGATGKPRP